MTTVTLAFITACAALVASVAGPIVSFLNAREQNRSALISTNRERWSEALRDLIAEYVAIVLVAALERRSVQSDLETTLKDRALLPTAERVTLVRSKILLMMNPAKSAQSDLCAGVERAYLSLLADPPIPLSAIRAEAEAITQAGRRVLRTEWERVKRGG